MTEVFAKNAVLIPNYNGGLFIATTINQFKTCFPSYSIVVVDDCSSDDSIKVLEAIDCVLIKREINGGFAAAINTGFRFLVENEFDYALVANSDLDIELSVALKIQHSLSILGADLKTAILGYCESGCICCGSSENISGFLFALRLSIIKQIGYFDESFYMYGEEQDYFRRVVAGGLGIYQTNIHVNHRKEGSSGGSLTSSWFAVRNALYLEAKRNSWWKMFRVFITLFLIINRLYYPHGYLHDPSYQRIVRPGFFKGNLYLIKALLWNIQKMNFKTN